MKEKIKRLAAAGAACILLNTAAVPAFAAENTEPAKLRVMCLGDSITDGFWYPGGYRITLCSHITEDNLESMIDMVGPNWGGDCYDPQHAGYSGYSIDNIAQEDSISGGRTGISSFADKLFAEHPADVVFLQIGTNDILSLYDLEHFGTRLEGLVDTVLDALPEDGALYLATLPEMDATNTLYISEYFFTVESMDEAVAQCNEQIRAVAQKKINDGRRIQLAEINHVLSKQDLFDGVHPSAEGYRKMGDFWYERLSEYLHGEFPVHGNIEPRKPVPGDLNADGSVTAADAVILTKALTAEQPLPDDLFAPADLDGNQAVNVIDLSLLKQEVIR